MIKEWIICFLIGFTPGIILLILAGLSYLSDKWVDWQVNKIINQITKK